MKKKINKKMIRNIIIVLVMLIIAAAILIFAPNFKKDPNEGKINFIINNNNVTGKMKQELYIDENGVEYWHGVPIESKEVSVEEQEEMEILLKDFIEKEEDIK